MIDDFFNMNTELPSVFLQLGIPISSFNWNPLHSPPGTIYAADLQTEQENIFLPTSDSHSCQHQ